MTAGAGARMRLAAAVRAAGGTLLALAVYGGAVVLLTNLAPELARLGMRLGWVWPGHPGMTRALWDFGGWLLVLALSGALAVAVLARVCRRRAVWCALLMTAPLLACVWLWRAELLRAVVPGRAARSWDALMRRDWRSPVAEFEAWVAFPLVPWLGALLWQAFIRRRAFAPAGGERSES